MPVASFGIDALSPRSRCRWPMRAWCGWPSGIRPGASDLDDRPGFFNLSQARPRAGAGDLAGGRTAVKQGSCSGALRGCKMNRAFTSRATLGERPRAGRAEAAGGLAGDICSPPRGWGGCGPPASWKPPWACCRGGGCGPVQTQNRRRSPMGCLSVTVAHPALARGAGRVPQARTPGGPAPRCPLGPDPRHPVPRRADHRRSPPSPVGPPLNVAPRASRLVISAPGFRALEGPSAHGCFDQDRRPRDRHRRVPPTATARPLINDYAERRTSGSWRGSRRSASAPACTSATPPAGWPAPPGLRGRR